MPAVNDAISRYRKVAQLDAHRRRLRKERHALHGPSIRAGVAGKQAPRGLATLIRAQR